MIAGDFNADGSYICKSAWKNVEMRHDPRFKWLIADDVDTTVTDTDCAYDRFADINVIFINHADEKFAFLLKFLLFFYS